MHVSVGGLVYVTVRIQLTGLCTDIFCNAGMARVSNRRKDYARADCYGRVALYTNVMGIALGICCYLALCISYGVI